MMRLIRMALSKMGYLLLKEAYIPKGWRLETDLQRMLDCKKIETVVDVGAFEGDLSALFFHLFPNAAINSIEPSPESFEILKRKLNHARFKLFNYGAGSEDGNLTFNLYEDRQLNSFKVINDSKLEKVKNSIEIKIKKLDGLFAQNIDFLKIDVEGFELECLRGAENLLNQNKIGCIYVEVGFCSDDNRHSAFCKISNLLSGYGFSFYGLYDLYHYRKPTELLFANALFLNDSYLKKRALSK